MIIERAFSRPIAKRSLMYMKVTLGRIRLEVVVFDLRQTEHRTLLYFFFLLLRSQFRVFLLPRLRILLRQDIRRI